MAYTNNRSFKSKGENKGIKVYFSISTLDSLILYSMSSNALVTKKSLINLKKLIDVMDETIFEQDIALLSRFQFLKELLSVQIDHKIANYYLVKEHIETSKRETMSSAFISDMFFMIEENADTLDNDDVNYLSSLVSDHLTHSYIHREADLLEKLIQDLKTDDKGFRNINSKFESVIERMYKGISGAKALNQFSAQDFSLNSSSASYVFDDTIKEYNRPNNYIKMGIKRLNDMIGGGLENGREYLIFGLPKALI